MLEKNKQNKKKIVKMKNKILIRELYCKSVNYNVPTIGTKIMLIRHMHFIAKYARYGRIIELIKSNFIRQGMR